MAGLYAPTRKLLTQTVSFCIFFFTRLCAKNLVVEACGGYVTPWIDCYFFLLDGLETSRP